jgi:hypothetical protein
VTVVQRPLDILFLADDAHPANAVIDHVNGIVHHSRHHWYVANTLSRKWFECSCAVCRARPPRAESWVEHLDFDRFDALVIHYSIFTIRDDYLPPGVRAKIAAFKGPKLQFLQDEYRWVDQISRRMAELGTHTLFTLVRPELVDEAYGDTCVRHVRKVTTLTGWVPEELIGHATAPIRERKLHVAYRGRQLPFWLGRLAQDKVRIADGVQKLAPKHGLLIDVATREDERIYGSAWVDFIASAKSVLCTESGASIWDHEGKVQQEVDAYLERHPGADFDTVARDVLAPYEGNLAYNALSPRLFEAIALKTPLVMFPGWYNGVVEPERHYISLEKDFSNFADVAKKLKDDAYLQALADRAYDEIVASKKYDARAFAAHVDQVVEETVGAVGAPLAARRSSPETTRLALERTTRALRTVDELPVRAALFSAARRMTLLLDENTGATTERALATAAWAPLLVASLPLGIAAIPGRAGVRFLRRELGVGLAMAGALVAPGQGIGERLVRATRIGLNHANNVLPAPLSRLLRAAGRLRSRAAAERLSGA